MLKQFQCFSIHRSQQLQGNCKVEEGSRPIYNLRVGISVERCYVVLSNGKVMCDYIEMLGEKRYIKTSYSICIHLHALS